MRLPVSLEERTMWNVVLFLKSMLILVSAEAPPPVVRYYDSFGQVVTFSYYEGLMEVECVIDGCNGREIMLLHETQEIFALGICNNENRVNLTVQIKNLKVGKYHCQDDDGQGTDTIQFVYRSCSRLEAEQGRCTTTGAYCIVDDQREIRCNEKFKPELCRQQHKHLTTHLCPVGVPSLCELIAIGNYTDDTAHSEETGSGPCIALYPTWPHIEHPQLTKIKMGETIQYIVHIRTGGAYFSCPNRPYYNLSCRLLGAEVDTDSSTHRTTELVTLSADQCKRDHRLELKSEWLHRLALFKFECNTTSKPDGAVARAYIYFVSLLGPVTIKNVLYQDTKFTERLRCSIDQPMPSLEFSSLGCHILDPSNRTKTLQDNGYLYIEPGGISGEYRCSCLFKYGTYSPTVEFKQVQLSDTIFVQAHPIVTTSPDHDRVTTTPDDDSGDTTATTSGAESGFMWDLIQGGKRKTVGLARITGVLSSVVIVQLVAVHCFLIQID